VVQLQNASNIRILHFCMFFLTMEVVQLKNAANMLAFIFMAASDLGDRPGFCKESTMVYCVILSAAEQWGRPRFPSESLQGSLWSLNSDGSDCDR